MTQMHCAKLWGFVLCADLPLLAAAGEIFIVLSVNFDGFPFLQQTSILIWRERSQSSVFITSLIQMQHYIALFSTNLTPYSGSTACGKGRSWPSSVGTPTTGTMPTLAGGGRLVTFQLTTKNGFFIRFIHTAIIMLTNTDNVRWPGTSNLSRSDRESHKTPLTEYQSRQ